jgi:uncharacterized Fe-S center protein
MPEEVFFIPARFDDPAEVWSAKIRALYKKAGLKRAIARNDLVAIKTHFGERGNTRYLRPQHIRPLVEAVRAAGGKPFLTETSTLYVGGRSNAVDHIMLAQEHGFTIEAMGVPIVMADGLFGVAEMDVSVNGPGSPKASLAADMVRVQSCVIATHVTGHCEAGLGGLIKNVGMGCASRKGKLRQHSVVKPKINPKACVDCGLCAKWCPVGAVERCKKNSGRRINPKQCIGCGECLAMCRQNAIEFDWSMGSAEMQRRMVEQLAALHHQKAGKIAYVSYLVNISKDCDCINRPSQVRIPDIGVLAGFAPLAIEQATLDLIEQQAGKGLRGLYWPQVDPTVVLAHGERLGLGSREYRLKKLDN